MSCSIQTLPAFKILLPAQQESIKYPQDGKKDNRKAIRHRRKAQNTNRTTKKIAGKPID